MVNPSSLTLSYISVLNYLDHFSIFQVSQGGPLRRSNLDALCSGNSRYRPANARGADRGAEEILETISVNMATSGTTGIAEALRVLKLLDELEKR